MRSVVNICMAAGIMLMVSIRPDADAALSPYSPAVAPQADPLHLMIFNPYRDEMVGIFQQRERDPVDAPSWSEPAPLAMIGPEPARPTIAPEPSAIPPAVGQPTIVPEPQSSIAALDKALPTIAPDMTPREAFVAPREPASQAEPRDVQSRRRARTAQTHSVADVLRIKFDGPALTPFAHIRFCIKYKSECRVHKMLFRGGAIKLIAERRQELVRINAEVNRSIVATNMNEPVAEEQWLISPKAGDCNDYAVTKRHKLIARGWPAHALLLAEVVTTWGEHHLVLVVRTSKGDLVADNLNANIRNWTKTSYEWVRVESPANPTFWSKIEAPQPDVVAMVGRDHQL